MSDEREVANSDRATAVPTKTRELAAHAANDLIALAIVQRTAPPPVHQLLEQVGNTMLRLAMHVHATLEEGAPCVARIEQRAEETFTKTVEEAKKIDDERQHYARGQVMRSIFAEPQRDQIGFRHHESPDKGAH